MRLGFLAKPGELVEGVNVAGAPDTISHTLRLGVTRYYFSHREKSLDIAEILMIQTLSAVGSLFRIPGKTSHHKLRQTPWPRRRQNSSHLYRRDLPSTSVLYISLVGYAQQWDVQNDKHTWGNLKLSAAASFNP